MQHSAGDVERVLEILPLGFISADSNVVLIISMFIVAWKVQIESAWTMDTSGHIWNTQLVPGEKFQTKANYTTKFAWLN